MPIIWNMKYILRYKVQFLSVKFCFCWFCWHIIRHMTVWFLLILLTYHQTYDSFEKICPQKAFLKDHRNFLQWQCWENLLMKNIFEGTVTMTLRATFSIVRSITWTVIMIVLTEMSYHLLQFWWNSKIKEELLRIKTLHSQMKL